MIPTSGICTTDDSSFHSILCNILLKFWRAMLSRAIWLHSGKVNDREGQPPKAESGELAFDVSAVNPAEFSEVCRPD
jgi:hypothetical protein